MRPLAQLGWLPRTPGTAHVATLLTDGSSSRSKDSLTLVTAASDTLLDGLVDSLFAVLAGDGQDVLLFLLDRVDIFLFLLLGGGLLLGEPRALGAALVLTLGTDLVGAKASIAVVAVAVHTHADGPLNSLDADGLRRGRDPLMRLQGESVLGEEGASSFLLESGAIEFLGDRNGRSRHSRLDRSWSGSGTDVCEQWHGSNGNQSALTQESCFPSRVRPGVRGRKVRPESIRLG